MSQRYRVTLHGRYPDSWKPAWTPTSSLSPPAAGAAREELGDADRCPGDVRLCVARDWQLLFQHPKHLSFKRVFKVLATLTPHSSPGVALIGVPGLCKHFMLKRSLSGDTK